jgi:hypothetical protein
VMSTVTSRHRILHADTQVQLTAFAKQCLAEMAPKYVIEVFQEAELLVNITQHVLVPKHQVRQCRTPQTGSLRTVHRACCNSEMLQDGKQPSCSLEVESVFCMPTGADP